MLQKVLEKLLNHYLAPYVDGISKDQLLEHMHEFTTRTSILAKGRVRATFGKRCGDLGPSIRLGLSV
eukprot:3271401-Amphidinium_carterae.1